MNRTNTIYSSNSEEPADLELVRASLERPIARLRRHAEEDFRFIQVNQTLVGGVYEKARRAGAVVQDEAGQVTVNLSANLTLSDQEIRALVFDWGKTTYHFDTLVTTKRLITLQLLTSIEGALPLGSLLVPFVLSRSLLEQISVLFACLDRVASCPQPSPDSWEATWEVVSDVVTHSLFATRLDWQRAIQANLEGTKRSQIEYKPDPSRRDFTAKQLLNAVDRLDRRIPGARATYEFLSEFVHPNYGATFALCKEIGVVSDRLDVPLMERVYGVGSSGVLLRTGRNLLSQAMDTVLKAVNLLLDSESEFAEMRKKVLHSVQPRIRVQLTERSQLFSPQEACPCGSHRKVRRCCGRRN